MKLRHLAMAVALAAITGMRSESRGQSPYGSASFYNNYGQRSAGVGNPARSLSQASGAPRVAVRTPMNAPLPHGRTVTPMGSTKPFANMQPGSQISPYLFLDARESATGVPVYYSLVKPQLDQINHNQQLQNEYDRMQRQLRSLSTGSASPQRTSNGLPTTGHGAQFMNLGGYYPQLQ